MKLLSKLKTEKLDKDWNEKQAVEAQVRNMIRDAIEELPSPYLHELNALVWKIYEHIVSTYDGKGKSVYDEAS
jgi:hypothetical protein